MNRREFLKTTGILTGAALIGSCRGKEDEQGLLPGIAGMPDGIPGQPVFYNTTCAECPANCGVSVKVINGCAVKLEGIPGHPINNGALCVRGQASLTRLYQSGTNRIEGPLAKNAKGNLTSVTWDEAFSRINQKLKEFSAKGLKNVFLSGRTTGSLSEMIKIFCEKTGVERLPEFEVYSHAAIRKANKILFGKYEVPRYKIENADLLITVGADVLETFVSPMNYSTQIARMKKRSDFIWCHVEPHFSLSGSRADKRLMVNPGSEIFLLAYLANNPNTSMPYDNAINLVPGVSLETVSAKTGLAASEISGLTEKLLKAEKPLVIAGGVSVGQQTGLLVAVLAGILSLRGGMTNEVMSFDESENYSGVGTFTDIKGLSHRLKNREIGMIFLSGVEVPGFYSLLANYAGGYPEKTAFRVAISDFYNETTDDCDVVLPVAHSLSCWGDAEPRKGLTSIVRPAVQSFYNSLSEGDILLGILRHAGISPFQGDFHEFVSERLKKNFGRAFEEQLLNKGYYYAEPAREKVELDMKGLAEFLVEMKMPEPLTKPVVCIAPSVRTYDGRSETLHLLNEIPDPLTAISYGNWVSVSEKDATVNGIKDGSAISITSMQEGYEPWPVKIQPGLAEGVYMMQTGVFYSTKFASINDTGEMNQVLDGKRISVTTAKFYLPVLSGSFSEHGRGIASGAGQRPHKTRDTAMYPPHLHEDYRWAMAIDLQLCSGCSACVAACYIENNIPVVGKEEHLRGREMSWLRIEPFYDEKGNVRFVPMMCQQCDNAPCEPVCPVYATYHTAEGLNAQIYNRCVGTRYCSNNCPYKVRRFNWLKHKLEKPLDMMRNPDVSVRSSGMMEKCTFCIQRIRAVHDTAKDEDRKIRDGEVMPACAQTCPMNAIAFGNILDKNSQVYKWSSSPRAYRVFEELGTGPAIYYLDLMI